MTPGIVVFAGSARKGSVNKKLAKLAAKLVEIHGGKASYLDLAEYPMPLFDQDHETAEGLPEAAQKLREIFLNNQGLLIVSPEYNSSVSPLLKNVIDWVSRSEDGKGSLEPYMNKTAALLSASPGALGGIRGLVHLKAILGNIKVTVIPEQYCLSDAFQAFDEDGDLINGDTKLRVSGVVQALVEETKKRMG